MRNKTWFVGGFITLTIILILSGLGFYINQKDRRRNEKPKVIEAPVSSPQPISLKGEDLIPPVLYEPKQYSENQTTTLETSSPVSSEEVRLLFEKELAFGGLIYPYLYVYDPDEGILKYLNLEDKTYRELYKAYYLTNISVSPTRKKIILKENDRWKVIDLSFDQVKDIKLDIKDFFWIKDDLYFFAFDSSRGGGLYKISDLRKDYQLIKTINLPDVKLRVFNDFVLVHIHPLINQKSPIFFINLKKPSNWQIYLEERDYYSIIPSLNGKYLYLSYLENNRWVSRVLNQSKKEIKVFDWGTLAEKCTFDELLVCGVPLNTIDNLNDWYKLKRVFNDKIVIFNPETRETKEIFIRGFYDILQPKLTPLGIIFFNRNDSKFYVINFEQPSLNDNKN